MTEWIIFNPTNTALRQLFDCSELHHLTEVIPDTNCPQTEVWVRHDGTTICLKLAEKRQLRRWWQFWRAA